MSRIGFNFNGHRFEGVGDFGRARLVIERIAGRDPLASEYTTEDTTAVDGVRLLGRNLPQREIEVDIAVAAQFPVDLRDAMRDLGNVLYTTTQTPLTFDDEDGYYNAVADWQESETQPTLVRGTAVFTCHDPFRYGEEVTTSPSGGQLSVGTNYIVEPSWRILTTSAASAGFTMDINGRTYRYDGSLTSGQAISIDVPRMETRVGGNLRALEVFGTYPVLEAENDIAVSVNSEVEVTYQERWI